MNASANNQSALMLSAGVAAWAVATAEPLFALGATTVALLLVSGPFAGRTARCGPGPTRHEIDDSGARNPLSNHVFRASSGGDPASAASASDEEEAAASEDAADRERGERAYEEFAAGLEEESSEEISFLPPYTSGRDDSNGGRRRRSGEAGTDPRIAGDLEGSDDGDRRTPAPRRFALGTVAIIRRLLEPADVERILMEQRRYPRLRFGDIAVQLDLLSRDEVDELVIAQEQGVFSDEEISEARRRLAAFHDG